MFDFLLVDTITIEEIQSYNTKIPKLKDSSDKKNNISQRLSKLQTLKPNLNLLL